MGFLGWFVLLRVNKWVVSEVMGLGIECLLGNESWVVMLFVF